MGSGEQFPLAPATRPLAELYDVALLDLDGVVYVGRDAVPTARDALAKARAAGMRLAFVTNNAARPPEDVAAHLSQLGVPAAATDVITSAQAAAHYLADRLPRGAKVLVVGTTGLERALNERGLVATHHADDDIAAVVQGYSPTLDWAQLAEGAIGIRRGVPWVATNLDPTVPSPRGPLPGNGSLVAALRHATGAEPVVTGKPLPHLHRESVQRSGATRPIVVGDRLDTDIEGANAVGCPSMLVLTGVTEPGDLLVAEPKHRPSYLAVDLTGLLSPHPGVDYQDSTARCGQWLATVESGSVRLKQARGNETGSPDGLDPLRALCGAVWRGSGSSGSVWSSTDAGAEAAARRQARSPAVYGDGPAATEELLRLGLGRDRGHQAPSD